MGKNRRREKLVRALNSAAKACGVSEVPVTSKKAKVTTLIAAIQASEGPPSAKTDGDTQGQAGSSTLCHGIAQSVSGSDP